MKDKNIVLIGMPTSGKTTIGKLLSKESNMKFIDTDELICNRFNMKLQTLLDRTDYQILRNIEEAEIMLMNCKHSIISTGGSVVYSEKSMRKLQNDGVIIYLNINYNTLKERLHNKYDNRGIAAPKHYTLSNLYSERLSLYKKYANITIDVDNLLVTEVLGEIIRKIFKGS